MKSTSLLVALTLIPLYSQAIEYIQGIPDGSYQGRLTSFQAKENGRPGYQKGSRQSKKRIHFLVQGYAGCKGCFIALALDAPDITDRGVQMVAYSAVPMNQSLSEDKITFTQYSLTPIGVDATGEVTLPNENPAMILNISGNAGTEEVNFHITPNTGINPIGFQNNMNFTREKKSPFEIMKPVSGNYRFPGHRYVQAALTPIVTNPDDLSRQSEITWGGTLLTSSGNYSLKEKFENIFSFNPVSTFSYGDAIKPVPSYIVMFVRKGGKDHLLAVNPVNSKDITCVYRIGSSDTSDQDSGLLTDESKNYSSPSQSTKSVGSSSTQGSLEYPNGPTAQFTELQVNALKDYAKNAQVEIIRLQKEASLVKNDLTLKKMLVSRIEKIAGDTEVKPYDLLLRQSLYAGLTLSRIIETEVIQKSERKAPGAVAHQIKILTESLDLALKYYKSDQIYTDGILRNRGSIQFNDKLVEYGVELGKFILDRGGKMIPISVTAAYGMIRWALGVLNRKILDDSRNTAFSATIVYLSNELSNTPEMADLKSDASAIELIKNLRFVGKESLDEISAIHASLIKE